MISTRSIVGRRYPDRAEPHEAEAVVLRKGSATTRVLACIERSGVVALSARTVCKATKLKRVIVGTALNELVHNGMIERVNAAPPFLYRVIK